MRRSSYRDHDFAFGQAMLTLRSAIGLTQTGLADYLGVSRRTIGAWEAGSKYPRPENLKQFIALAVQHEAFQPGHTEAEIRALWKSARQKVLLDEAWLAEMLSPLMAVRAPDIRQQMPMMRTVTHNLPFQPTPFIGRAAELSEIAQILDDPACHLLTLLGPGGVGKTRLALEAAARQTNDFADGVVFVPLAALGTANEIISAIGDRLSLSFAGQPDPDVHLLAHLRNRHLLLVLDNFEHLLEGADLVQSILQNAPNITMLITSQARLNVQAEWLFDVEGLPYPLEHELDESRAFTDFGAIELFVQRAAQVQPGFSVDQADFLTITHICQQVAGMPLAIELAAACVRTQSMREIEQRIQVNLDTLSTTLQDIPLRHRSLRAAFDHSWNLLTQAERVPFSRLAVFRGSFTAAAAEQVAGATLKTLFTLAARSLLRQVTDDSRSENLRFIMLEPLREYALEKLAISGKMQAHQQAHAVYFYELANVVWDVPTTDTAASQLDREHDNIRAALHWALDAGDITFALRLGSSLWRFWRRGVLISEGRMWLEALLALEDAASDIPTRTARLQVTEQAAWLASDQHDFKRAAQLFGQAMALRRTLGEDEDDTSLLVNAALQARATGDYHHATTLLEDVVARHHALGHRNASTGQALYTTALVLREQGDFTRSVELFNQGIQLFQAIGDREGMAQGQLGLSDVARDQGQMAQVRRYGEACLTVFHEFGTQWATGFTLNNLALACFAEGQLLQAHTLISECVALFRSIQNDGSLAEVLITLGRVQHGQGDLITAQVTLTEALQLAWTVGPRLMVAVALETLAAVMVQSEQPAAALHYLAHASILRAEMGTPVYPVDQPAINQNMAAVRAAFGEAVFTARWSEAADRPLKAFFGAVADDDDRPPVIETAAPVVAAPPAGPRVDWGDALSVPTFYGREWEQNLINGWIVEERCRVVSLVGLGGIGKSTLSVNLMRQVADRFEVVIWRSLRDIPVCDALLDSLLQVLSPHVLSDMTASLEQRLANVLQQMRAMRVLIVLDNVESVLMDGEHIGQMRPEFEGFGRFLRQSAATEHQSCVLLTSREKPADLVPHEGSHAPVRALRLAHLDNEACEHLLAERGIGGSVAERAHLIGAYAGNPLALKIVAQTIVDLFDGEPAPFLEEGEMIYGGIRDLLAAQFNRLSTIEQTVMFWLAILREPTTLDEITAVLVTPVPRARLLEAVEALHRCSLIERGPKRGSFTLQSVVMEYITARLIADLVAEIKQGQMKCLIEYGMELASIREFVRQTQERLIAAPSLINLRSVYGQPGKLEVGLLALLDQLRTLPESAQGYGPANLTTLLRLLRGDLRRLDLSHLALRSAYLQGVAMQDASLSNALIQGTVFNETFDAVTAVTTSSDGRYWATGSRHGEVRLWSVDDATLQRVWRAHGDMITDLVFSPDALSLASAGSWDGTLKKWDVASGALLWTAKHPTQANKVEIAPDGRMLATTGYDAAVRLWNGQNGRQLHVVEHPETVYGLAWSPQGHILATGDMKGVIRLWAVNDSESVVLIGTLEAHTDCVEGLVFSPDGLTLASGGWDGKVRLWDVASGDLQETFSDYSDRVFCVVWSPNGQILASGGRESAIWLWDTEHRRYQATLQGQSAGIYSMAFTPDSRHLLNSSDDTTLRVWDIASARCIKHLRGYAASIHDVDWSPDSEQLVTGGSDALVTLFANSGEATLRDFHGHHGVIIGVSWCSNGQWIASSEWHNMVRLWEVATGNCFQILQSPDEAGDCFDRLAWSPDGMRLAIGTYAHGIQLFDMMTQRQQWLENPISVWIRHVAWHPDGIWLVGGGADGIVYLWDTLQNKLLQRLTGHHSTVTDVAWSPDGTRLASCSRGQEGGELFVWDAERGERLLTFEDHPTMVYAVVWTSSNDLVVSADGAGTLRWWDLQRAACIRVQEAHQGTIHSLRRSPDGTKLVSCGDDGAMMIWDLLTGEHLQTLRRDRPYERLNITGIRGLTAAQKATLQSLGAIETLPG